MPPGNYRSHGVIIAIVIREGGEPRPMGSVQKDVKRCVCVNRFRCISTEILCIYIYFFSILYKDIGYRIANYSYWDWIVYRFVIIRRIRSSPFLFIC